MATNHTEHYQLNLWEPTDKFVREEFNENFQKLDQAYSPANQPWVTGTYTGTGALKDSPLAVSLGFRPRLLILLGSGQIGLAITAGGSSIALATYYHHPYHYHAMDRLTLTNNGFTIWEHISSGSEESGLCRDNVAYQYFALR